MKNDIPTGAASTNFLTTSARNSPLNGPPVYQSIQTPDPFDKPLNVVVKASKPDPDAVQVGGDHYKKMAIQPTEYCVANNLTFAEGNVVKYVTRHKSKGGADDIRKAIHYLHLLLKHEYGVSE